MEQKRIKVRLTENSPYSDYGYYKKGDIGYIDGYVNDSAVIILENGKFVKADLRWIELVEQKSIKVPKFKVGDFIQFNGMGHTRYTIKEVCGLSHYINTCNKRMDMSYTDANFELVEQKPADKVEHKFKVGDVIRLKGSAAEYTIKEVTDTTYYTNGWSCGIERCEEDYELVEQKPWSEDDKVMLDEIVDFFENGTVKLQHDLSLYASWLKSIRPQSHWKPSEEQIQAVKEAACYSSVFSEKTIDNLISLSKQLKKLKG